ncbi:hypothetical protein SAMN04488498_113127 [Mesorhizobium albiziae]|uniref:Homeodomain-like domain-containing protein n=1 Tax=Neomesorhizobium albiziae TaxID=335020 RepID=A0A1I4CLW3_9HYPH|nr:hypothetical protein [Mesorhizobium albiziae]GLS29323.1 hypothetical protein GCM10007937_10310 [Mesorhizobium albiziae]SFK81640.1 hypothetical protein SAMN04488498_113127 [Mesorhizobium albiziae]
MHHVPKHRWIEDLALSLYPRSQPSTTYTLRSFWEKHCEWERRARVHFLERDASDRRVRALVWWYVVEYILRDYSNYNTSQHPFQFPSDFVAVLCEIAGYLATGKIPEMVSAVAGRGTPAGGPREREQIELAQVYARCVREGEIVDKSPIKTIAETYGVHRRTARRWANETESRPEVYYPGGPKRVIKMMRAAASEYARTGRSSEAIRARGRPAIK